MALKSHACCTERGIFRRCLNNPHIATMKTNPTPRRETCNQSAATGFNVALSLRLNRSRHSLDATPLHPESGIAAKVHGRKK